MKKTALFFVLVTGLLLTACGGGDASPEVVEVEIVMTEYSFDPATITVPQGAEIHLTLINNGTLEHEVLIGRNAGEGYETDYFDRDPGKVKASGGKGFHVGSDEDIAEEGYHVEVEPGATGTLVFTADKSGEWEIGCFIDDGAHYEQGMIGTFIVE